MDLQPIEEVGSLKYSHSKNYEKGGRGGSGEIVLSGLCACTLWRIFRV